MTSQDCTRDFAAMGDFVVDLFCRVDDAMTDVPKHSQAKLCPSELVTLGLLFALKGRGNRAFYRWAGGNLRASSRSLPDRTRLFRLLATHRDWTDRFLAEPTLLGVADSYGIELIHPRREGRSQGQIGKKGKSNLRWIVGAKVASSSTASGWSAAGTWTRPTWRTRPSILLGSSLRGSPGAADAGPDRPRLPLQRPATPAEHEGLPARHLERPHGGRDGSSMLTGICQIKKVAHRAWPYLKARLAFCLAAFNLLAQWDGLHPDESGFVHLSLAQFVL